MLTVVCLRGRQSFNTSYDIWGWLLKRAHTRQVCLRCGYELGRPWLQIRLMAPAGNTVQGTAQVSSEVQASLGRRQWRCLPHSMLKLEATAHIFCEAARWSPLHNTRGIRLHRAGGGGYMRKSAERPSFLPLSPFFLLCRRSQHLG